MKGVGTFCQLFFFLSFSLLLAAAVNRPELYPEGERTTFRGSCVRENRDRGFRVSKNGKPALSCKASGLDLAAYRYDHQSLQFANL